MADIRCGLTWAANDDQTLCPYRGSNLRTTAIGLFRIRQRINRSQSRFKITETITGALQPSMAEPRCYKSNLDHNSATTASTTTGRNLSIANFIVSHQNLDCMRLLMFICRSGTYDLIEAHQRRNNQEHLFPHKE